MEGEGGNKHVIKGCQTINRCPYGVSEQKETCHPMITDDVVMLHPKTTARVALPSDRKSVLSLLS